MESDLGCAPLRGFFLDGDTANIAKAQKLVKPYCNDYVWFLPGEPAADVYFIQNALIKTENYFDASRYFDYHHSDNDHISQVNPIEMTFGSAVIGYVMTLFDAFWE